MILSRRTLAFPLSVTLFFATSCGGGNGTAVVGSPGDPVDPGDGTQPFLVDPNEAGRTEELRLVEVFWGRLVDVHDIDASGNPRPEPVFRNFVVRESLFGDGVNMDLETNPITQETRLVVLRNRQDDPAAFDREVGLLSDPLAPVLPRNDDGSSAPPFSLVARNAALVLRFNDALDSREEVVRNLRELVRIQVGYPPNTPFAGRLFFDRNHGVELAGRFHPTRVIVDMSVSEAEALADPSALALNPTGLPASLPGLDAPNVSVRIPTEVDMGSGQFEVLRALSGAPMTMGNDEPGDRLGVTRDVVRAFRSGNDEDVNRGVMSDFDPPEVVGSWPMRVTRAVDDPAGSDGFDFILEMSYDTICQRTPEPGDILQVNSGVLLEVRRPGQSPDANGGVSNLLVRAVRDRAIEDPVSLISGGIYLSTLDTGLPIPRACWLDITPRPTSFPSGGLSTRPQIAVRFTEPMRPSTVTPFESFMLVRGGASVPAQSTNIVVGQVTLADDLRAFTYTPTLPLAHVEGQSEAYSVRLDGPTDFAGNPLRNRLPFVDLRVAQDASTVQNASTVFRFDELDEIEPIGRPDIRGQFFHDPTRGVIRPRPVTFFDQPVDDSNPVPSVMVPFGRPIVTPLSSFGSRLQTVWRYADLGWQVEDETKHNIDVIGLSWTPLDGSVIADIFPEFEMVMAHSRRLPDEAVSNNLLPRFQNSGLVGNGNFFTDNILEDPLSPAKIVHHRSLGYIVDPTNLFQSSSGKTLMPYPWNRVGAPMTSYLWRDTAVLARGGPAGAGIPLAREVGPPLGLDPGPPGRVARPNDVPSFGLPLLMEFRTFPSGTSIGLNGFRISLAINSSAIPAFRSFSTGGINVSNNVIRRNPDFEDMPQGGFNPLTAPPGRRTRPNDNGLYPGQMDYVIRVSRAHTVWVDTSTTAASFVAPVVQPPQARQPVGTEVVLEYRGATGFGFTPPEDSNSPFDARLLDPYGEMFRVDNNNMNQHVGSVRFVAGTENWTDDITDLDGARFFQVRLSFVNDVESGLSPELSALGFAYMDE